MKKERHKQKQKKLSKPRSKTVFNVSFLHATQSPYLHMLLFIMFICMFGSGSEGRDANSKDHYHEVPCYTGLRQLGRCVFDGVFDGDAAEREEDLHLHLFFFNRSTMAERYVKGRAGGWGGVKLKESVYLKVLMFARKC